MNTLVLDIGGRNVKVWHSAHEGKHKIPSGPGLTPEGMLSALKTLPHESFERVSIGYPGRVRYGRPATEAYNLGTGWQGFDFAEAFGCPVRVINDACLQALGSFEGGRMLYLGLGTGAGTALVDEGHVTDLALGHMLIDESRSIESALSRRGLKELGLKRWTRYVEHAASILKAAFLADYVMIGGGNAKKLTFVPEGCRRGGNAHAYTGGVRLWEGFHGGSESPVAVSETSDGDSRGAAGGFHG